MGNTSSLPYDISSFRPITYDQNQGPNQIYTSDIDLDTYLIKNSITYDASDRMIRQSIQRISELPPSIQPATIQSTSSPSSSGSSESVVLWAKGTYSLQDFVNSGKIQDDVKQLFFTILHDLYKAGKELQNKFEYHPYITSQTVTIDKKNNLKLENPYFQQSMYTELKTKRIPIIQSYPSMTVPGIMNSLKQECSEGRNEQKHQTYNDYITKVRKSVKACIATAALVSTNNPASTFSSNNEINVAEARNSLKRLETRLEPKDFKAMDQILAMPIEDPRSHTFLDFPLDFIDESQRYNFRVSNEDYKNKLITIVDNAGGKTTQRPVNNSGEYQRPQAGSNNYQQESNLNEYRNPQPTPAIDFDQNNPNQKLNILLKFMTNPNNRDSSQGLGKMENNISLPEGYFFDRQSDFALLSKFKVNDRNRNTEPFRNNEIVDRKIGKEDKYRDDWKHYIEEEYDPKKPSIRKRNRWRNDFGLDTRLLDPVVDPPFYTEPRKERENQIRSDNIWENARISEPKRSEFALRETTTQAPIEDFFQNPPFNSNTSVLQRDSTRVKETYHQNQEFGHRDSYPITNRGEFSFTPAFEQPISAVSYQNVSKANPSVSVSNNYEGQQNMFKLQGNQENELGNELPPGFLHQNNQNYTQKTDNLAKSGSGFYQNHNSPEIDQNGELPPGFLHQNNLNYSQKAENPTNIGSGFYKNYTFAQTDQKGESPFGVLGMNQKTNYQKNIMGGLIERINTKEDHANQMTRQNTDYVEYLKQANRGNVREPHFPKNDDRAVTAADMYIGRNRF